MNASISRHINNNTMYCIVAIFKNESEILEEWINHYINEGCLQFFLIDNGSTDNYLPIINKYNKYIYLVIDNTKYKQSELYQKYFINKVKKYNWVLVCDLDEFVYARKGFKTITDYLNTLPNNISQIAIPWKIFGSNGFNTLDKKEPDNVISNFTKRTNYNKSSGFQGVSQIIGNYKMNSCKNIVRTNMLTYFGVHNHIYKKGNTNMSNNISLKNSTSFVPINEDILQSSYLHLNHYVTRSLDWFTRIKMTRGDAVSKSANNVRNLVYFNQYNEFSNDMDDFELLEKRKI